MLLKRIGLFAAVAVTISSISASDRAEGAATISKPLARL